MSSVHVLIVRIRVKPGCAARFRELWTPLAKYCLASEPGCLSYELSGGESDEDDLVIFERYSTKADLDVVHNSSAAFKEFQAALGAADIILERSRSSYTESGVGFMQK